MMKKLLIPFSLILLSATASSLRAQSTLKDAEATRSMSVIRDMILDPEPHTVWQVGPYGGIDYNIHSGGFTTTEGSNICCVANSGTGIGGVAGIKAFIPIADEWTISPRVAYEGRNGTFDGNPETYKILGANNSVEDLLLTKQFVAHIATIGADLFLTWNPSASSLYVGVGPSVASIVSQRFTQTEHISSPSGVSYLGGAMDQTVLDSDLDITKSLQVLAKIGLGYKWQVSDAVSINPELEYAYPLTKFSEFYDWAGSALQGTIGILFTP